MFAPVLRRTSILVAVVSATAAAQGTLDVARPSDAMTMSRRSALSLSVIQSRPQGAFGRNVGLGYGLDGAYLLRLDRAGIWSVRASAGVTSYGRESRRTALSETVGGRVMVDVTTGTCQ